jgi:formiminoglutamate deiminase
VRPQPTRQTYHCELAWLPPGRVAADVTVEVDGAYVLQVNEGADPPPGAELLRGLVVPGLANSHSHAFHRALRGRTQAPTDGTGSFWTWREQMYAVAERLDPDRYLTLARAVFAEMAMAGITSVGEFHYLHHAASGRPYDDPNAMGHALVEAAHDAGLRIALLDTCYLAGGIGRPLEGVQQRFGDGDVGRWAERVDALRAAYAGRGDVTVGAALHSVRAVPADQMPQVVAWAAAENAPLHVHVSEQRAENEACLEQYGVTPTRLLHDQGALGPRSTAVHATHLQQSDIELLGSSGTAVCLCPTTERDLADGIGPAVALRESGAMLTLGTDSHAMIDLFEEARAVELDERLARRERGIISAARLLDSASAAGQRALGWTEAGNLRVGAHADLVAVDTRSIRTAGGGATAENVVFAASAADVTDVIVDGRTVVTERRHVAYPDIGDALAQSMERIR